MNLMKYEKFISKLFDEYLFNKVNKNEIKYKIELLLLDNNYTKQKKEMFYVFEILTLLNNYYIEKYLSNENMFKSDNKNNNKKNNKNNKNSFNFIFFLNYHQFFIINIILAAYKLKENETYSISDKSYKEIQDLFYTSLKYNINNIIKNLYSVKYYEYFVIIFVNIFGIISKIYNLYEEKEGKINISFNKTNFNKTCFKKLVDFYIKKYGPFFEHLSEFWKNHFDQNNDLIRTHKSYNMIGRILQRKDDKITKKPIIDIFDFKKFFEILNTRKTEAIDIKLLIGKNKDLPGEKELINYQNLISNIQTFIIPYENRNILNDNFVIIKRRNMYRKIKKKLFSWNNSYSNLEVFYKNNNNKLKFKISNFLSKDLSRKLLVPILDFDFYVPKFKSFNWENNLFQNISESNYHNEIYNIDLKIFNSLPKIILPELNDPKFFIEEVCYIKTNHHINGLLFILKSGSNSIFFATKILKSKEELLNNSNYDIDNSRCFGSIFSSEFNKKEEEIYFSLLFSEIDFIFIRKYCFRDNALEIYTKNHRSYYFKFEDYDKRNKFLENLINRANRSKKVNLKPIKGIDENNKAIIIGYYREDDEIKPFSNINNILELWKANKISTFEYLMWVNIYGNRSYQDIGQYPIFPWLLSNHENKKFDSLISDSNNFRDLNMPVGLIVINEKGKIRKNGYIEAYKIMIMDLFDDDLKKEIAKEEDKMEETNNNEKNDINIENINNKKKNILEDKKNKSKSQISNKAPNAIVYIQNQNIIPNCQQIKETKPQKVFDYNINLDKLYYDLEIPYDFLPYVFGSHFSNAMYVSHYLCRLFPYSFTSIEIQGVGFDCPERLFLNLQNSQTSSMSEKGDLREIIPEFFSLPELFININKLNMGQRNNEYVEDVTLPTWCLNNPYIFVENYRGLLECGYLNINSWIDLIFGFYQRGKAAENMGNIYMPFTYDGVINHRIPPEKLINHRNENAFQIRCFEMGVNPTKVFGKKIIGSKNKMKEQITIKEYNDHDQFKGLHKIPLKSKFNNIIFFDIKKSLSREICILNKEFIEQKLIIDERETMPYTVKEINSKKNFPFSEYIKRNVEYKLIVKQIFDNEIYVITGLFDGKLHLYINTNKINIQDKKFEYPLDKENIILDKSVITALAIDKDEKYIIYGTKKGSIVIYTIERNVKNFNKLSTYFQSHPDFSINYISINSDLNLFADCAYDGYVNIYSLPKYKLIRSIYINPINKNIIFNLDFVFLSAQPLASVVVYSNEASNFKSFSINGNEQYIEKNSSEKNDGILTGMISPIIFTDSLFNDYLLYIMYNKTILISKFPSMQITAFIKPKINENVYLTNLCITADLKYIYVLDEFNNSIYVIHQQSSKNGH